MKFVGLTYWFLAAVVILAPTHAQRSSAINELQSTSAINRGINPKDASGKISGRVVTDSGKPLLGATITVRQIGATVAQSTTTDQGGNFLIKELIQGLYRVSINAPGYVVLKAPDKTADDVYRLGSFVSITVTKGGVITGRITNSNGTPLTGLSVKAVRVRDIEGKRVRNGATAPERLTDDRGIYRIYGLEPGRYEVWAGGKSVLNSASNLYEYDSPTFYPSAGSREGANEVAVQAGMEVTDINITYHAQRGHSIYGTIAIPLKQQVSVFLTLESIGSATMDYFSSSQMSGADSSFAIHGLADGTYLLTARVRNSLVDATATRQIKINGADLTNLNLNLINLSSIFGRVDFNAEFEPCQKGFEFQARLIGVGTEAVSPKDHPRSVSPFAGGQSFTAAASDGSIRFSGLSEGSYRIKVDLPDDELYVRSIILLDNRSEAPKKSSIDVATNGILLKAGETLKDLVITVSGGAASVKGRVQGSAIDPNTIVVMVPVPAEEGYKTNLLRFAETPVSNDGTFSAKHIPPGKYFILALAIENKTSPLISDPKSRATLIKQAETGGKEVELKRCQQLTDFEVKR